LAGKCRLREGQHYSLSDARIKVLRDNSPSPGQARRHQEENGALERLAAVVSLDKAMLSGVEPPKL